MGIIVILIAVSLTIALLFLLIFFWNLNAGQYDDMYTPSVRILFEESKQRKNKGNGSNVNLREKDKPVPVKSPANELKTNASVS